MTEEERKAKNRERTRRYRMRHPDRYKESRKRSYLAAKADPDRYARMMECKARWRESHREQTRERSRAYIKAHKRKMKRAWRFQRDKMKMLFRECPELYAAHRRYHREYGFKWRIRHGQLSQLYRPRLSIRIPDTCSYGRVLDTRSVFLWNNLPAASLVAGRAYRAMQWRETHCDRFGRVCR